MNIGCGGRFRNGWLNIDFVAKPPNVVGHNLLEGIPLDESAVDFAYSSHVLEHFDQDAGLELLREQNRILRPGGTIRVIVPDLEMLARNYLAQLDRLREPAPHAKDVANHEWSVLAMIDQCSRNQSSGAMTGFLRDRNAAELGDIFELEGSELRDFHSVLKRAGSERSAGKKRRRRLSAAGKWVRSLAQPETWMSDKDREALRVGRFRLSGEVHYCMYDEASLKRALGNAGFVDIRRCTADESALPDWRNHHLDTEPDGSVYKPLSLFVEATKP